MHQRVRFLIWFESFEVPLSLVHGSWGHSFVGGANTLGHKN